MNSRTVAQVQYVKNLCLINKRDLLGKFTEYLALFDKTKDFSEKGVIYMNALNLFRCETGERFPRQANSLDIDKRIVEMRDDLQFLTGKLSSSDLLEVMQELPKYQSLAESPITFNHADPPFFSDPDKFDDCIEKALAKGREAQEKYDKLSEYEREKLRALVNREYLSGFQFMPSGLRDKYHK